MRMMGGVTTIVLVCFSELDELGFPLYNPGVLIAPGSTPPKQILGEPSPGVCFFRRFP